MNRSSNMLAAETDSQLDAKGDSRVGSSVLDLPARTVLLVVLGATAAIHCVTLSRSPTVWQDEVQIVDYGRLLRNPSTDWSVTLAEDGRPRVLERPIYVTLQQVWLGVWGTNPFTVRLLSLLSAFGAALALWWVLRLRGVNDWTATIVALAFWADPLLVRGAAGARADAFTILFCLLAAGTWRKALHSDKPGYGLLAGGAASVAFYSWATAPVTLVLAVYEYIAAVAKDRRLFMKAVVCAILGLVAVAALALLLLVPPELRDRASGAIPNVGYGAASGLGQAIVSTVVASYRRSPWVVAWIAAAAVVAVWRRQSLGLLATMLAGVAIASIAPPFYTWRLMYVVPLAYVFLADVFSSPKLRIPLLLLLLMPSLAVNVGLRTGVAIAEWERRDYHTYSEQLAAVIPPKALVFGTWDHYYAGLDHGWRMYPVGGFSKVKDRLRPAEPVYLILHENREVPQTLAAHYDWQRLGEVRPTAGRLWTGLARSYAVDVYQGVPRTNRDTGQAVPNTTNPGSPRQPTNR